MTENNPISAPTENTSQNQSKKNNGKGPIFVLATIIFLGAIYTYLNPNILDYLDLNNWKNKMAINETEELYKIEKSGFLIELPYASFTETLIEEDAKIENVIESEIESINEDNSKDILLNVIKSNNIYTLTTSRPEGFYIMVGSFNKYKNAVNLQNNNPTQLKCYIFDTNEENFNRVGLFVSETDLQKTQHMLSMVKKIQPLSWILYNTEK